MVLIMDSPPLTVNFRFLTAVMQSFESYSNNLELLYRKVMKSFMGIPAPLRYSGLIAVPAAALYLLFGGDAHLIGSVKGAPSGLVNLGETCFLNSILQALSSCSSFVEWLPRLVIRDETKKEFINALAQILKDLSGEDDRRPETKHLVKLLDIINSHGWFNERNQQDAHELYHALVNIIHTDIKTNNNPVSDEIISPLLTPERTSESRLLDGVHNRSGSTLSDKLTERSQIRSPLMGSIATQMRCQTCLYKNAVKQDSFSNISLNFPPQTYGVDMIQLDDLLRYYFVSEMLEDVLCENCSKIDPDQTPVRSRFTRDISVGKMPRCLSLHIQRLCWHPVVGDLIKRSDRILFPLHLNMNKYSHLHKIISFNRNRNGTQQVKPCQQFWYELEAVIEHRGSENAGHFITYRRFRNDRWMFTSDLEVYEVTSQQVLNAVPYMIFYERYEYMQPSQQNGHLQTSDNQS